METVGLNLRGLVEEGGWGCGLVDWGDGLGVGDGAKWSLLGPSHLEAPGAQRIFLGPRFENDENDNTKTPATSQPLDLLLRDVNSWDMQRGLKKRIRPQ